MQSQSMQMDLDGLDCWENDAAITTDMQQLAINNS